MKPDLRDIVALVMSVVFFAEEWAEARTDEDFDTSNFTGISRSAYQFADAFLKVREED